MPAVRWEVIRQEAQRLATLAGTPPAFAAGWEALVERYADRNYRRGQDVPPPRLPMRRLPPAVLSAVWQTLRGHLLLRPEFVLPLADHLWPRGDWESRLLAARLLGLAPVTPPQPVFQRLMAWLQVTSDPPLLDALLQEGTARLLEEAPAAYLDAVQAALREPRQSVYGLQLLQPALEKPTFHNAPRVFNALEPLLTPPEKGHRPYLAAALRVLARRWPQETAPFLRSLWLAHPSAELAWLIRRALPHFPAAQRQRLRDVLGEG